MWLKILKYALKVAVATGLADKGKDWLKSKVDKAFIRTIENAQKKVNVAIDDIDEADELHPTVPEVE